MAPRWHSGTVAVRSGTVAVRTLLWTLQRLAREDWTDRGTTCVTMPRDTTVASSVVTPVRLAVVVNSLLARATHKIVIV